MHGHREPLRLRQPRHGGGHNGVRLALDGRLHRGLLALVSERRLGRGADILVAMAFPPARGAETHTLRHLAKPCGELPHVPQGVDIQEDAHERFLRHILRGGEIGREVVAQGVHPVLVPTYQRVERRAVACPTLLDQLRIRHLHWPADTRCRHGRDAHGGYGFVFFVLCASLAGDDRPRGAILAADGGVYITVGRAAPCWAADHALTLENPPV